MNIQLLNKLLSNVNVVPFSYDVDNKEINFLESQWVGPTEPILSFLEKVRIRNHIYSDVLWMSVAGERRCYNISACLSEDELLGMIEDITEVQLLKISVVRLDNLCMLGKITGGASHEINNHLTCLSGAMDMLQRTKNPEKLQSVTRIIRSSIDDISLLMERLMNLSRSDQGQRMMLDANQLIQNVTALLQLAGSSKRIQVDACLPATPCWLEADRCALQGALMNIGLNGITAMEEKGGLLRIINEIERDHCTIRIVDEGVGMDGITMQRVFEPFFTGRIAQGHGMGMAICYQTIKDHNGDITVSSQLGRGTEFHVRLPIASPPAV